jgi:hypothetical protein
MVVVDNIVECECGQIHQLDPNGMSGCSWKVVLVEKQYVKRVVLD